jgi:hypothetical protein
METDQQLKDLLCQIQKYRCYNDATSIILRLEIIKELNTQIKNTMFILNHHCYNVDNMRKYNISKNDVESIKVMNYDKLSIETLKGMVKLAEMELQRKGFPIFKR